MREPLVEFINILAMHESILLKVRVQKDSSDALFTPKMEVSKQTILNTAYVKILEIFPSSRESLYIQNCASKSVGNQSCLHCESDLDFCMGLYTKKYMATDTRY